MGQMDFSRVSDQLAQSIAAVPQSGLLLTAIIAMLAGFAGTLILKRTRVLGRVLRTGSTLALTGILVLIVLQLSRMDPRFDMVVPEIGLPQQVVEGGETRVPLAPDGHFWLQVDINGVPANFLVDTGATLTAVSAEAADAAGLEPRRGGIPVRMQTANGAVAAQLTTIEEMRFGNVAARGIDAVIAPNIGPTNVLGMNVLSRLESWRVENGELILVPHNPQPVPETTR